MDKILVEEAMVISVIHPRRVLDLILFVTNVVEVNATENDIILMVILLLLRIIFNLDHRDESITTITIQIFRDMLVARDTGETSISRLVLHFRNIMTTDTMDIILMLREIMISKSRAVIINNSKMMKCGTLMTSDSQ